MPPTVRPQLVAFATLSIALAVGAVLDAQRERAASDDAHAMGEARVAPVAAALERAVGRRLAILEAFRAFDREGRSASAKANGLPEFSASVFRGTPGLREVIATHDGALRWHYSAPGDEAAAVVGRATLLTMVRDAASAGDAPVAAGPIDLVDGSRVLLVAERVSERPIERASARPDRRTSNANAPTASRAAANATATTAATASVDEVAMLVDLPVVMAEAGLDTVLVGWNVGVSTATGRYIAGRPAAPDELPVRQRVAVAGLHWIVSAAPESGWTAMVPDRTEFRVVVGLTAVALALLSFGVATVAQRIAREADARRTAYVHESARHEEGLRRLDLALGAAQMGIWEWAVRYDRVRWSPELGPMFGRPLKPAEMPMPTFLAYVLPDDRPMLADRIADVARHGGRLRLTFRVLDGEGNERWLRLEGAALADTSGEPTRVLAVVADVTDRMRLEAQLQQAAKLDAVGSVAAGIAHDFGNMLMAIQASVELATSAAVDVSGPTAHHVRTDLQEALGALRHARMLTTQLMAYSRREPPRPRAVELGEAVRALEPLLRRLLGTRGKLELVLDEQPVMVMIDPSQLDQVLLNLVVNARDVTPDGGRIIIATGRETTGDRAWLAVQDSGPGIPEDVIPRIFDAFFTTKASGKGTGLGLATVHRIVTTAGGAVNAANDPTGGAIFTVYLPVAAGPALIAVA